MFNSISILQPGKKDTRKNKNHSALLNESVVLRRKPEHIFPDMFATDDGHNAWYKYFDQKTAVERKAIAVIKKGTF